jgi:hypothetical protein
MSWQEGDDQAFNEREEASFHCVACDAPTDARHTLCPECDQQVKHGLEERRLQDAGR